MSKLVEVEKLLQFLREDKNVQRYQKLEKLINIDIALNKKIKHLKSLQKEIVKSQELGLKELHTSLTIQYNDCLNELEETPLFVEYTDLQTHMNALLREISETFAVNLQKK